MTRTELQPDQASPGSVFGRIIVGVDGTEPGFQACRQAARLVEPGGWLEVFSAVHLAEATLAGFSAPRLAAELERDAAQALRAAESIVGPEAASRLVNGPPTESLLRELERRRATLVAVGSHGHSRVSEIMVGGTAGAMLHMAPCSVLIARPPRDEERFPGTLVCGIDGSAQADAALAVAQELSRRFDVSLRTVTALRGKDVDLAHVHLRSPYVEAMDKHPVDALVDAARGADLLVVGNRGLHGMRALGSVSERVAHRAPSSVLVVRCPGV